MGARVAAEIASTLEQEKKKFIIGLLCLSYPLHPVRKTSEQRLSSILPLRIPTLFISGTQDAMCQKELMMSVLGRLNCNWSIHWVEGGDHALTMKGEEGVSHTKQEIFEDIGNVVVLWAQSVFMGER